MDSISALSLEARVRAEAAYRSGDEDIAARAFDRAKAVIATLPGTPAARSPHRRWLVAAAIFALVVGGLGSAVVAGYAVGWLPFTRTERTAPRRPITQPQVTEHIPAAMPAEAPPETAPVAALPERPRPTHTATVGAGDLLQEANRLRAAGEHRAAIAAYRRLQDRWRHSHEASVSRISLGRLLSDHGRRPTHQQQALAQFDAYLDAHPAGNMAHEARVGRARALQRLGRRADEARAWREILRLHPDSLYSVKARERLQELTGTAK